MPGIAVDFEFEDDDIAKELDRLSENWPEHSDAILTALAEDLVGELKREIPTNTGRAKGTVRAVERGDSVLVVAGGQNGVDYIEPLLEGSEPHPPGPPFPSENSALARWARRNNYPGGFDSIYWNIARYGTEPHDFVSGPLEETRGNVKEISTTVLRNRGVFE